MLVGVTIGVVALRIRAFRRERAALRRAREQLDAALRAALVRAAEQLSLPASPVPTGTPAPGYVLRGGISGYTATLTAFDRYTVISVGLVVPGLPAALNLNPWPRGRAAEDIYLGVAVESGYDVFDAHFCVTGPPELLRQCATTLDRALLDVIAEGYSTAFDVSLGAKELRLGGRRTRPAVIRLRQSAA